MTAQRSNKSERRREKRHRVSIPIKLSPIQGEESALWEGFLSTAQDISSRGAYVLTSEPKGHVGEGLMMEFILPTEIGPTLKGQVRNITLKGMGLEFDQPHPWITQLLTNL